eukprot:scaffold23499_cov109-Cylindrotheca_fusiformis.AAC.11
MNSSGAAVSCPVSKVHSKTRPSSTELENPRKRRMVAKNVVIKPSDYVKSAFKANGCDIDATKARSLKAFTDPSEVMISSYTSELLADVRKNRMGKLRELHSQEMTKFLLQDVKVDINIRDDYYRTPLHDACWTPEPNFELVDMLIRVAPEHLLLEDVRGFTPFDYVRTDHWKQWLRFLWERRDLLRPKDAMNERKFTPVA